MDYHNDTTHITKSMLSTFMDSPRDYYEQYITRLKRRKEATRPMVVGSVCHAVLLQGMDFEKAFVVYPDSCLKVDGTLNGKSAAAFRADNPDAIGFGKQGDDVAISNVLFAVEEHALGSLIRQAQLREEVILGTYENRGIKCKPDFLCDDVIYDLKFMDDVSESAIRRSFKRFRYWLQDAHYSAVCESAVFRFWVVETEYPFRIKSVVYDERSREIADEAWGNAMDALIACEKAGVFEDNNSLTLTLSPWEVGADDEGELVDIGDVV